MRLRKPLLIIATLFFLVLGISLAEEVVQESQSGDIVQNDMTGGEVESGGITPPFLGQEWTGVDTTESQGTGTTESGDTTLAVSIENPRLLDTVPSINTMTSDIPALPSLLISEVFFDGSDERLEISNIGSTDFSGTLVLTGIGINTTINSFIPSQQSIVVAKSGRTFGYFLDQSVIKNYASMGFTDTKQISVSLFFSGIVLDSFNVDTGTVVHYNDKTTSLEKVKIGGEYIITGTSSDRSWNVQSGYIANPGKLYELSPDLPPVSETGEEEQSGILPKVRITEVYLDSDQRFELTNVGSGSFSGNLSVSGAKSSLLSLNVNLTPGQSKVYGDSCSQILNTVVIGKTGLNLSISQSKSLSLFILSSGVVIDSFFVDSGYVKKYKDYNISFEKVGINDSRITTKATLDRRYNNTTGFVINPGKVFTTGENLIDVSIPETKAPVYTGALPINCGDFTQRYEAEISEVFAGNEVYHPYVELVLSEDPNYDSFFLSGSALLEPIEISLDQDLITLEGNTTVLISDSEDRYNQGLDSLDNPRFALQKNGGWLLLYGGNGQSRQLLDIVYLTGVTLGSSLYYNAHDQGCAKVLDETGDFSPGFDRKFLQYFAVSTSPKIEYVTVGNAVAGTCPICPDELSTQQESTGKAVTQQLMAMSGAIDKPQISSGGYLDVKILTVDYDPPGSDVGNEKITLEADLSSGEDTLLLSKPDRYLRFGTTKRYLSGLLQNGIPVTLQGSFSFPNSSKSGNSITVQLRYQNTLVNSYTYTFAPPLPRITKPKTNVLTGTFLVTEVVDGDTVKILYSGAEQSIRFLGIDAPETTLLRNKKLGCFGQEAKAYLTSLLLGKQVHLEFDPTQQKTDSYKRRLNYVYLDDQLINEMMLAQGYAKEYTFKTPYQYRAEFLSAQQEAQDDLLGLRDPSVCPENALQTGKNLTGESWSGLDFSGLTAKITYVLPNPKGKDSNEEIGLKVEADTEENGKLKIENGKLISGLYLEINGKKKKIKDGLPLGIETILSGSLGLPNKASCIGLGYSGRILDTLCYPLPKEGQKIFADGHQDFDISPEENSVLADLTLQTMGSKICAMFGPMQVICKNAPLGKTAVKTANENKLYEKFITIIDTYIKDQRKDLYYTPDMKVYFALLRSNKKNIKAGIQELSTSHGEVPVYDLDQQIHIIETYSLAYRAMKGGQTLLDENPSALSGTSPAARDSVGLHL